MSGSVGGLLRLWKTGVVLKQTTSHLNTLLGFTKLPGSLHNVLNLEANISKFLQYVLKLTIFTNI